MRKFLKLLLNSAIPAPWDIYNWIIGVLPLATAGTAMIAGYIEGVAWSWAIMIAALTFGGASTGLLRFSEWRQRQGASDKLAFQTGRLGVRASQGPTREILLGVQFISTYDYPLECEITRIASRVEDRVPSVSSNLPQTFEVPPRGVLWFDDTPIRIDPRPGGTLEGTIEFEIWYGRKGSNKKYQLTGKKRLYIGIDDAGKVRAGNWNDAI